MTNHDTPVIIRTRKISILGVPYTQVWEDNSLARVVPTSKQELKARPPVKDPWKHLWKLDESEI